MSIEKQQYLSLGEQLVNVIQSVPFVDANRDDNVLSCPGTAVHASGLRILIAPILD